MRLCEATRRAGDELREPRGPYDEGRREEMEDLHRRVCAQIEQLDADEG